MPKYVPVLVALFLAVAPVAAMLQPAPPVLHIGAEAEPHGARPAPPVSHIGAEAEPHGARMAPAPPVPHIGAEAEPHG